jgi:hypothetical protein
MNEAEWWTSMEPKRMLDFLVSRPQVSLRKMRLFAAAAARDLLAYNSDSDARGDWGNLEEFEQAIVRAEVYADGKGELYYHNSLIWIEAQDDRDAAYAVLGMDADVGFYVRDPAVAVPAAISTLRINPAHWLREIFGPLPYCSAPAPEATVLEWNDRLPKRLAQAAYEERRLPEGILDPTLLAVLADALEEAGCTDNDILSHCRGPGPHVRGCWALDLLLAKA